MKAHTHTQASTYFSFQIEFTDSQHCTAHTMCVNGAWFDYRNSHAFMVFNFLLIWWFFFLLRHTSGNIKETRINKREELFPSFTNCSWNGERERECIESMENLADCCWNVAGNIRQNQTLLIRFKALLNKKKLDQSVRRRTSCTQMTDIRIAIFFQVDPNVWRKTSSSLRIKQKCNNNNKIYPHDERQCDACLLLEIMENIANPSCAHTRRSWFIPRCNTVEFRMRCRICVRIKWSSCHLICSHWNWEEEEKTNAKWNKKQCAATKHSHSQYGHYTFIAVIVYI